MEEIEINFKLFIKMANAKSSVAFIEEEIVNKIHLIQGQKIMNRF